MSVYSCKSPQGLELGLGFRKSIKLLSGGRLNNFLKAARCLGLVKCLKVFHFS